MEFVEIDPQHERLAEVWNVMRDLREHLDREGFEDLYREGYAAGYRVVGLFDEGVCKAAAGYHLTHGFAHGPLLYVDDLVTASAERSSGYGKAMNDYLVGVAKENGCAKIQLDSGTHRTDAHRFYFREGYVITSFHFNRQV